MKKIRLLVYEGSPEWIDQTLSRSLASMVKHIFGSYGSIRVVEIPSEVIDAIEKMTTNMPTKEIS